MNHGREVEIMSADALADAVAAVLAQGRRPGGWDSVRALAQETRQEDAWWLTRRPVACPNDGEPLVDGHCPFDGWDERHHPRLV